MRRLLILFSILFLVGLASPVRADILSFAPSGRVIKVLPLLMDTNNQVSPSPSLFDRDAYQFYLLVHSNNVAGMRFDVQWRAFHASKMKLKLRVELKGIGKDGMPTETNLEQVVTPKFFRRWTSLTLSGAGYKNFGVLAAWRATLWNGNQLMGEQESFLWSPP